MRAPPFAALLLAAFLALPAPASAGDPPGGGKPKGGEGAKAPPAEGQKDWKDHMGDIPFVVGREAGMKEVAFTGKPILFFYTATW